MTCVTTESSHSIMDKNCVKWMQAFPELLPAAFEAAEKLIFCLFTFCYLHFTIEHF